MKKYIVQTLGNRYVDYEVKFDDETAAAKYLDALIEEEDRRSEGWAFRLVERVDTVLRDVLSRKDEHCAWCNKQTTGFASAEGSEYAYPSCGAPGHGTGFVEAGA